MLDTILTDLKAQPEDSRKFLRYLSLAHLHNLRNEDGSLTESARMMDQYRAAVAKLVNSLSTNARISLPKTVGEDRAILRLDLRDYDLSLELWEQIGKGYPYGILDVDAQKEKLIREATGDTLPYLRADWFVFACAQPPLYFDLLGIPETESEMEKILGLDLAANLRQGRAIRAGFRQSGLTEGDRLIERHELGRHPGFFWTGYEFSESAPRSHRDLFRAPLGPVSAGLTDDTSLAFRHDARTILFSLPNGLFGTMVTAADGSRLGRAPSSVLLDRDRPSTPFITGISCFSCHNEGIRTKPGTDLATFRDELGPVVLQSGLPAGERRHVENLHAQPEKLKAALQQDRKSYLAALAQVNPGFEGQPDTIQFLYNRFKKDITARQFASELGKTLEDLLVALDRQSDRDLRLIAAQMKSGLPFPRRFFQEQFEPVVEALGYRLHSHRPIPYEEYRFDGASVTAVTADSPPSSTTPVPATGAAETPQPPTQHNSRDDRLVISTDKTHYRGGELLKVKVQVREDSYLRLYLQSAGGTVRQIFPNEFQRDNFVRAGKAVTIPDEDSKFDFRLRAPYGEEVIVAVASPVQFSDFQEGESYTAPKGFRIGDVYQRGTRGLTVEAAERERPAAISVATAVYSVSE